jgi:hypothetical protein
MQSDSRSVINSCSHQVIQSESRSVLTYAVSHQVMQSVIRSCTIRQSVTRWALYWQRDGLQTWGCAQDARCSSPLSMRSSGGMTSTEPHDTTFHIRNALFTARDFPFLSAKRPRIDETTARHRKVINEMFEHCITDRCGSCPQFRMLITNMTSSAVLCPVRQKRQRLARSIDRSSGILLWSSDSYA